MFQLKRQTEANRKRYRNLLDGLHHIIDAHLTVLARVVKASLLGLRSTFLQRNDLQRAVLLELSSDVMRKPTMFLVSVTLLQDLMGCR